MNTPRKCERCGATEEVETLALNDGELVCQECNADIERAWAADHGHRHYLDTFSPNGPDEDSTTLVRYRGWR